MISKEGKMFNDINYEKIEADFRAGWAHYLASGELDSDTCRDERGEYRGLEFREGFEASKEANDTDPARLEQAWKVKWDETCDEANFAYSCFAD